MAIEMVPVYMPKYGMTMTEGTVVSWLRAEGDLVKEGEPLLIVETEKVNTEIEAPTSGRLARVCVAADTTVPVGTVVAYIAPSGASYG